MSGHSKWAQIKRQKGAADVRRGLAFTKLSTAITLSVKQGGGITDPQQNFRLRLAIDKAHSANMPKDTIERAIEKGVGKGKDAELVEAVYEGFGPGGVAVIVEAATDNKQRTSSEIKNIFEKSGGHLGIPGAVSYQFQLKGLITVKKNDKTIDDIFLIAADAGADDVEDALDEVLIYTKPEELAKVRKYLEEYLSIVGAELIRKPTITVPVTEKHTASQVLSFVEKLEDANDVQKVYANFDITDSVMASEA